MRRSSSSPKTADALRKTLQTLEADPALNPQDQAFVNLKHSVLQRILELQTEKVQAESAIHLVGLPADTNRHKYLAQPHTLSLLVF